jgi:succinate dehydrogenase/fumarate reductase flavoprotein subunit
MPDRFVETDVLVVGAGAAGCFAAIKAREKGIDIILVDKNVAGWSGCSFYSNMMLVFNPEWGDNLEAWLDQFSRVGEYIVDLGWVETLCKESYARFRDLVDWGVSFIMKDGSIRFPESGEEPQRILWLKTKYRYSLRGVRFGTRGKLQIMRKAVEEVGVRVIDRVMITDLLKQDGRVVGAVGFHTLNGDFYLIKAKAVIIATGGTYYRGAAYGRQMTTGDGAMMGYRAGAELMNMEFGGLMYVTTDCDTVVIDGPVDLVGRDRITNALGEEFMNGNPGLVTTILWPLEVHAGRGPLYHEPWPVERETIVEEIAEFERKRAPWVTMLDRVGIDLFKDRIEQHQAFLGTAENGAGVRINELCETTVPGLYAAGNSAGCGLGGANYASGGTSMMKASVTGHRSGLNAAAYACSVEEIKLDETMVELYKERVLEPLNRRSGFTTDHVITRVQQTILPYEVRIVMQNSRLEAALTMVEFFRDHFLPKILAADIHDLRKAHEAFNMVQAAEIQLRTAIMRTESRGSFYREDYPRRDDENWLKWIVLKQEEKKMKLWTVPVPEDSLGDTSQPYDERYILHYKR